MRGFGLNIDALDERGSRAREPHLVGRRSARCIISTRPRSIDPGRLAQAYADLFVARGGRFYHRRRARASEAPDGRWSVATHDGELIARDSLSRSGLGPI